MASQPSDHLTCPASQQRTEKLSLFVCGSGPKAHIAEFSMMCLIGGLRYIHPYTEEGLDASHAPGRKLLAAEMHTACLHCSDCLHTTAESVQLMTWTNSRKLYNIILVQVLSICYLRSRSTDISSPICMQLLAHWSYGFMVSSLLCQLSLVKTEAERGLQGRLL